MSGCLQLEACGTCQPIHGVTDFCLDDNVTTEQIICGRDLGFRCPNSVTRNEREMFIHLGLIMNREFNQVTVKKGTAHSFTDTC